MFIFLFFSKHVKCYYYCGLQTSSNCERYNFKNSWDDNGDDDDYHDDYDDDEESWQMKNKPSFFSF